MNGTFSAHFIFLIGITLVFGETWNLKNHYAVLVSFVTLCLGFSTLTSTPLLSFNYISNRQEHSHTEL